MAEYIVNGAVLRCDKGQYSTNLTILAARMCMAGKPAAHSQDCVPDLNIHPFGACSSGTYFCSKKAKAGKERPCVLDLMDHYYLVDENMAVSDSVEIMKPLDNCLNQIRFLISGCVTEMTDIQHTIVKKMNYQINDQLSKQYAILWQKTDNVYLLCESVAEITNASAMFTELVSQNCSYLGEGNEDPEITVRLNTVLMVIKQLNEQAALLTGLPKVKEKNLITTESFAVCRCGGIITFENSGQ